jgi:hypothetical protein
MRHAPSALCLHTRPDEQPDTANVPHMIERDYWWYRPSCRWCGQEHHREDDCPNRPSPRAKSFRERVVSVSNG